MIKYFIIFILIAIASCAPNSDDLQYSFQKNTKIENDFTYKYPPLSSKYFPKDHLLLLDEENFSYRKAILRLEQSYAELEKSYGLMAPSIYLGGNTSRIRNELDQNSEFSLGGTLNFDIDPFGRLGDLKEAAKYNYKASYYDIRYLKLNLKNQFVKQFHQVILSKKNIKIAYENLGIAKDIFKISKIRYEFGKIPLVDFLTAKQNLENAKSRLETQKQSLIISNSAYSILLGRENIDVSKDSFAKMPDNIALSIIPASILDIRPDIISSRSRFEASGKNLDATIKSLFPSLSINLSAQNIADNISNVFTKENLLVNLTGSLSQLLFDGRVTRSNITISEKGAEIAKLSYLEDVTNALNQIQKNFELLKQNLVILEANNINLDLARKNLKTSQNYYKQGRLPLLNLLDIQSRLLEAEKNYITSQKSVLDSYVDLLLSLGQEAF